MTFTEAIPVAKQLAERQLSKGFDVEAFLILCEINKMDTVPESNIDEHISDIGKMFVNYHYNHSVTTLENLTDSFMKAFLEIYNSVPKLEYRDILKTKIENLIAMMK
jgi:hypothetical protein